ncbi:hypothetical protein ACFFK7_10120 [Pseudoalteromonas xiamenensis]|uniref:hypothetical protein n=1 Tax=Pseudoalteromonas xiamenensis TaxID=882626 RepID=UPI0035ECA5AD
MKPNTRNAETITKLIWLLSQVTADDAIRAEKFTKLLEHGRELENAGHADIVNCDDMDTFDKAVFARVYRKHAQRHLIKSMDWILLYYSCCRFMRATVFAYLHSKN